MYFICLRRPEFTQSISISAFNAFTSPTIMPSSLAVHFHLHQSYSSHSTLGKTVRKCPWRSPFIMLFLSMKFYDFLLLIERSSSPLPGFKRSFSDSNFTSCHVQLSAVQNFSFHINVWLVASVSVSHLLLSDSFLLKYSPLITFNYVNLCSMISLFQTLQRSM